MYFVHLEYPGTFPDTAAAPWSREAERLCSSLEMQLVDAALALDGFESAGRTTAGVDIADWESDRVRAAALEREIVAADPAVQSDYDRLRLKVDAALARDKLARGLLPRTYSHRRAFVHARSFLFSVDMILKLLDAAADIQNASPLLRQIAHQTANSLPTLRHVRNSAAHMEDRVRARGRYGRPLALKPSTTGPIRSTSPVLILDSLNGSRILTTIDDGSHAELDVSASTLDIVHAAAQQLINAIPWTGPPRFVPT